MSDRKVQIAIIGGGIVGASILNALARLGQTDLLLIERTELTAGSTWHAAGLVPIYTAHRSISEIVKKTIKIYEGYEAHPALSAGWHKCGNLRLASTNDRLDEYKAYMPIAKSFGIDAHLLSKREVQEYWPLLEDPENRIIGGLINLEDGHAAPADCTQSLVTEARSLGGSIALRTEVLGLEKTSDANWRIKTNKGDIIAEKVVMATGNYAMQSGKMVGLNIPAIPLVHQYLVGEAMPEIQHRKQSGLPELPILRDDRFRGYFREEGDSMIFGPYETADKIEHFAVNGVPKSFGADLLPPAIEDIEDQIEEGIKMVPSFGNVGIKSIIRGPINVTGDRFPMIGPAPGLDNFWLAEGFAGGIQAGPGVGHYLAQWIVSGEAEIDLRDFDIRRFGNFATKTWTMARNIETYTHSFDDGFPGQQLFSARPQKTTPCYDVLDQKGAVWGSVAGWEVPLWFADERKSRDEKLAFKYKEVSFFENLKQEAKAVREGVALQEMTYMVKFEISGDGAGDWLDQLLANRIPRKTGGLRLCHLLTPSGGVLSEFVVVNLGPDQFYLVSSPTRGEHDFDVLSKALPLESSISIRNVSEERGIIAVHGPDARHVLEKLVDQDISHKAAPWLNCRVSDVALVPEVRMLRVNFVGELGWELHHPIAYQRNLVCALMDAGKEFNARFMGSRAIDGLRLEKSYKVIGRDLNIEHSALQAGLERFIDFDKQDFIGRSALLAEQKTGLKKRLVSFKSEKAQDVLSGNEGLYSSGKQVGYITSANYSFHEGCVVGLAYVDTPFAQADTCLEIEYFDGNVQAVVIPDSPYDPEHLRSRM